MSWTDELNIPKQDNALKGWTPKRNYSEEREAKKALKAAQKKPKQQEVKVQKTSMSRDQELQLGKEATAQRAFFLHIVIDRRQQQAAFVVQLHHVHRAETFLRN